jgi:hypothetical protein
MNEQALLLMLYTSHKSAGEALVRVSLAKSVKLKDLAAIRLDLTGALAAVTELERRCVHGQDQAK